MNEKTKFMFSQVVIGIFGSNVEWLTQIWKRLDKKRKFQLCSAGLMTDDTLKSCCLNIIEHAPVNTSELKVKPKYDSITLLLSLFEAEHLFVCL